MRSAVLTPIRLWERVYFLAVGLLALWVGVWGFFVPDRVGKVLPFVVPPLHARFLGAMYLSGLTFMIGAAAAPRWAEVRVVPAITAFWTGGLLVVSFLHFDQFDLSEPQEQVWFAAYVAYPLIALWLLWRHRGQAHERSGDSRLPSWVSTYLTVQGAAVSVVAAALLLAPGPMVDAWPWPITRLLAQIYAAPLAAYAVGSLLLSRQRTWPEVRVGLLGMAVFAAGVLIASLLHLELFSIGDLAAWMWFAAFVGATMVLAVLAVLAVRATGARAR